MFFLFLFFSSFWAKLKSTCVCSECPLGASAYSWISRQFLQRCRLPDASALSLKRCPARFQRRDPFDEKSIQKDAVFKKKICWFVSGGGVAVRLRLSAAASQRSANRLGFATHGTQRLGHKAECRMVKNALQGWRRNGLPFRCICRLLPDPVFFFFWARFFTVFFFESVLSPRFGLWGCLLAWIPLESQNQRIFWSRRIFRALLHS